jgi:FAD/FMN-containing dehydrogenase
MIGKISANLQIMSEFKFVSIDADGLEALLAIVGEASVVTDEEKVDKLSKDFFWYSPLLKEKLESKKASAAVRVDDLETLKAVVSLCYKRSWPITVRGGGTGNYGQCIPLCGGLVIDLTGMDRILSMKEGVVRAEPGARLGKIEPEARSKGYEFRCLPSTWVKSSLGGFLCGGSGGIGSITWGGIANQDNVKSVTVLSVEAEPKLVKFEEREAIRSLHAYGTTGIMVEIEMRLAPKRQYQQVIISGPDWAELLLWTDKLARQVDIPKRLVTQFENPVPSYFRPLKKYLVEGEHATFLLIGKDHFEAVIADAEASGLTCVYSEPLKDPLKPPYITDYTWNHGTLWAIKADPSITYLQCGYEDNFQEQMQLLRDKFPGEIFQHLEWTAWSSEVSGKPQPGDVRVGGLPKVMFKDAARLQEIIDYCGEIGVGVANPHTCFLEEGGRQPNLSDKQAMKAQFDPKGLLNPGKMKTYKDNPFLEKATA